MSAPNGTAGWLFGTIHALPDDTEWRTPKLAQALAGADLLVVEVAELADGAAGADAFTTLATSPGLPPLLNRVPSAERPVLDAALRRADLDPEQLTATETWAAALMLANAASSSESGNGVDRALLESGVPALGLEGYAAQFAIFDRLAEADQRVLLREAARQEADAVEERQRAAWLAGDLGVLEREMRTGIMADPDLREALLVRRNQAWAARVRALLARGRKPLVAVGAGHMVGPDGLPALLAAGGLTVRRIQ